MDPIVSTDWLAARLKEPDLRIVDAPFYLPGDARLPKDEFEKDHIPGSVLFDIEAISDHANPLPHMLASPDDFAEAVGSLGISDSDRIVVYDHAGLLSAGRVWWNFRAMGHDEVYVLDGGLPRWIAEGRPIAGGPVTTSTHRTFTPVYRPALVRDLRQVEQALASGVQVLDARPRDRFQGAAPEPRPGISSGHMPGAFNTPHAELVENGALKSKEALAALFRGEGVDVGQPVVTTCGSGISAAIIALALARLGKWDAPVYDGAWTEWASKIGAAISLGH
jgi:thiosulfate/3-mercaptopyruvate sulfurtransferase